MSFAISPTRSIFLLTLTLSFASANAQHNHATTAPDHGAKAAGDWQQEEASNLREPLQLTPDSRFFKAGEAYFSPDDSKIIFQAVENPEGDGPADEFYAMFVADIARDGKGNIQGLKNIKRISPLGSANTCGWFHPTDPNIVLFSSTIGPPTESHPPGYQRATGRYRWMFPPEMSIVQADLRTANGTKDTLKTLIQTGHYAAESSLSKDGRHLLYCSLESGQGDLYVKDLKTNTTRAIVKSHGYDGGPFFSPDGQRICFRSDRNGNNLLQLFVADLEFDETGAIIGIKREYQLTDNVQVNWCPYWTPDGRHLIYGTSEISHRNYEVFLIDADPGNLPGSPGPLKYGTRKRRITFGPGADILPVISNSGRLMMWTGQRGASKMSQLWVAELIMDLDPKIDMSGYDPSQHKKSH